MFRGAWRWVKSIFQGKEPYDLYRPDERMIYHYWDGKKLVDADPLTLYKKMMVKGPELAIDLKVANTTLKDAPKAHDNALLKIREIFSLKTFEEGGPTQLEVIRLFEHFLLYCDTIKKNSRTLQTTPTPSEASKPILEESQPTSNTLDSGSTESERSSEEPGQSTSVPELPSEPSPPT